MPANITPLANGDLHVEHQGHKWRRVSGQWQMLGNSGKWFACPIQDRAIERQVEDFEYCLQPYTFAQGPAYPTGRKYDEDIGAFIRRLQIAELRKGALNIFAPVPMTYTPGAEQARVRAGHIRSLSRPYSESFRKHLTT